MSQEEAFICTIKRFQLDKLQHRCSFCQINESDNNHSTLYGYAMVVSFIVLLIVGVMFLSLKKFKMYPYPFLGL